ncbi:DUF580-domain-containing protein [Ascobolus immersus RN42]|uniref:Protein PNS1 n=1 Tax=Ascobolus immersus RN42 TaxID=1160509 RepID=A0A3N4HRJ1_ASCIM|nr:DUF580-domain-containing protein [Ascobolus immersus RN42]
MAHQGYPPQGYPPQQSYPMQPVGQPQYQQPTGGYPPQQPYYGQPQQTQQPYYGQPQQPPQTQYYPQHPPTFIQGSPYQPSSNGVDSPNKGEGEVAEEGMEKPVYNDKIFAILFILNLLGFIAVSVLALRGFSVAVQGNQKGKAVKGNKTGFGASLNSIILLGMIIGAAYLGASIALGVVRKWTKGFIYAAGIMNIVIGIGTALYYFAKGYYSAAIVFLIFGIFYAIAFWSWRPRIPFAVVMLNTVMGVAKKHGHVFLASAVGGIVALVFAVWFAVTMAAVYAKYTPDGSTCQNVKGTGCSSGKVTGLIIYITFSAYWITEFIKNAVHVTVSGVFGSWYFLHASPQGMPKNITRNSAKRALTFSFGSISFGSLIVAILATLRQLTQVAQRSNADQGNFMMAILFTCLKCILDLVNWLVEFFNHYAYSYIALYGKPYVQSAKTTWQMMKDRGIDALVNDSLIDPVLTAASIVIGYLCALLAFIYLEVTRPAYNNTRGYTPVAMAFGFLIGLQICNVLMTPIKSGVATIFVALAFDPEVCRQDMPELWEEIRRVYPEVSVSVGAQVV